MQVGDYAEILSSSSSSSSSTSAAEAQSIFLESSAEAILPKRPAWTPEMLSGFAADRLLIPLGGLGTDRCGSRMNSTRGSVQFFLLSADFAA